jgi:GAF domain-containing protein
MISLIDSNEQWFKSEWGLKTPSCARAHSFCGHAILQQGDEPTVILDTHRDWRFAKNPLTVGPPHIRFYAGAPLRTQDGFNIGTLAVIDDQPRGEFSPRQRHTLKEFAANKFLLSSFFPHLNESCVGYRNARDGTLER